MKKDIKIPLRLERNLMSSLGKLKTLMKVWLIILKTILTIPLSCRSPRAISVLSYEMNS